MGGPGQVRRIRAAGECNDNGRNRKPREQEVFFFIRREGRLLAITNLNQRFHAHAEYSAALASPRELRQGPIHRRGAAGQVPAGNPMLQAQDVSVLRLFEVQKDVHGAGVRIGLQPMAHGFVMQRQLAKNLLLVQLEFR